MRRWTTVGISLLAALCVVALTAVSALAAGERGELVLTGAGGPARLRTTSATWTSTASEWHIDVTAATSATASVTFHDVEEEGTGLKCTSAGQEKGTIASKPLTLETGWISREQNEVGVDFKPATGSTLLEQDCEGGLSISWKDSVIGHWTPLNTSGREAELNLIPNLTGTANSPESVGGGPKDVLEAEYSSAPGVESEGVWIVEHVKVTNHGNSSACKVKKGAERCKPANFELNTIANPARPEFGRCKKEAGGQYEDSGCTKLASARRGKDEFVPIPG
jgi:hypothetical protein